MYKNRMHLTIRAPSIFQLQVIFYWNLFVERQIKDNVPNIQNRFFNYSFFDQLWKK